MFRELDESLRADLAALGHVIESGEDELVATVARSEVPLLLAAMKALLDQHRPDKNGQCPTCRDRRFWRLHHWRRPNVPCRAFLAARLAWTVPDDVGDRHSVDRHVPAA
ncbi:hypothetical protein RM788_52235 [Umezawaea sp. Da 62-37]|nr:hypothetical protein [Umezawaea sp. Da 62-37]WNV92141.1 hypothetical protein RM788_52235 [Umezawaea sp. Da 62-37]